MAEVEDTPFLRVLTELRHVKDEPRLLVIIAHGFVDLMVNAMIERRCRNPKKIIGDHRTYPHSAKLTLLHEMGILSDHHFKLLDWFRRLRNDAAHEPFFKMTADKLDIFVKEDHRDLSRFHVLCMMILLDMWKSHEAIIGPYLLPGMYEETSKDTLFAEMSAPEYMIPLKNDPKTITLKGDAAFNTITKAMMKTHADAVAKGDQTGSDASHGNDGSNADNASPSRPDM